MGRYSWFIGVACVWASGCQEYALGTDVEPNLPTDGPTVPGDGDGGGNTGAEGDPNAPNTPRDENERVDEVTQPAEFLVDVLFVVDNSGSMEDNQDALTAAFPTFIDYFEAAEGVDYHVGVVSTDVEDPNHSGKLRSAGGVKWLDNDTADKQGLFVQMAGMGTGGSGDESGRAAVLHALTTHVSSDNAGFVRPEASLATIIISDENDDSALFGVELTPFINEYANYKGDPALVSWSHITGPVPGGCSTADPGFEYPDVRLAVGGIEHSICDADWDKVLQDLAAQALSGRTEFYLSDVPELDTLEVQIIEDDKSEVWLEYPTDVSYDATRNSVTLLDYTPGPMAEVFVHYTTDFGSGW